MTWAVFSSKICLLHASLPCFMPPAFGEDDERQVRDLGMLADYYDSLCLSQQSSYMEGIPLIRAKMATEGCRSVEGRRLNMPVETYRGRLRQLENRQMDAFLYPSVDVGLVQSIIDYRKETTKTRRVAFWCAECNRKMKSAHASGDFTFTCSHSKRNFEFHHRRMSDKLLRLGIDPKTLSDVKYRFSKLKTLMDD